MKSCVALDPLRPSSGLSHGKVPERKSKFVHGVWGKRWGQNNHPNLDHLRAFGSQRHLPLGHSGFRGKGPGKGAGLLAQGARWVGMFPDSLQRRRMWEPWGPEPQRVPGPGAAGPERARCLTSS